MPASLSASRLSVLSKNQMKQRHLALLTILAVAGLTALSLRAAAPPTGKSVTPAVPPLPAVSALKVLPASLTLKDGRDERRVLVLGVTADGKTVDLTADAKFKPAS